MKENLKSSNIIIISIMCSLAGLKTLFQDRDKKRLLLKLFSLSKIIFHTTLVLLDIISDFLYVISVEFYNEGLKAACIIFIIIIPLIIYSITLVILFKKAKRERERNRKRSRIIYWLAAFWVIIGPTLSILYPTLEKFDMLAPGEFKLAFQLASIEFLCESLPQLIIQGSNNSLTNNWTGLTRFSFALSMISVIRGCYILSTTFYRRQFEVYIKVFSMEKSSDIEQELKKIPSDVQNIENEIIADQKPNIIENYPVDTLKSFIKFKFEEKFLTEKLFQKYPNEAIFNDKKLNQELEKIIEKYDKKYFRLSLKKTGLCERITNPIEILIMLELVLMFISWFCNLLYLVIAQFKNESLKFSLLLFLGFGYIGSISGKFEKLDGVYFRKLILFRLCLVSHFDYFMKSVFEKEVRTSYPLVNEVFVALFCWLPVIAIQASNNADVGKSSGIYLAVIVMNSFNLVIICCRILTAFIREIYFDSQVEPDVKVLKMEKQSNLNNTLNLENSVNP